MIVDSHCHIFTAAVIASVASRRAMVKELRLNVLEAGSKLGPSALEDSALENGVDVCLLLPTAAPEKVRSENNRHLEFVSKSSRLKTLGTLHPEMDAITGEIRRMFDLGSRGFKFSSFSQRFELLSRAAEAMMSCIENSGKEFGFQPVVLLDTFTRADIHFGADPRHITSPGRLMTLAKRHPGINFLGAHMGGLGWDPHDLRSCLTPLPNLYLDTSNAAHTLEDGCFVDLVKSHGAGHILFGTDWPWFHHAQETQIIMRLLDLAGFGEADKEAVFGGNARRLLGLCAPDCVCRE